MKTNQYAAFFFGTMIFGGLFLNHDRPAPASPPKHSPAKTAAAPLDLGMKGSTFSFTLPDPKRPGKLLYELRAASANGQLEADGYHGVLTTVWAKLYQSGKQTAILTAPRAQGGSANKDVAITGLGGVVVKSLIEPGTILTADTVVWYGSQNKMVATGHVYYHSGKTGATMTGPRAVADTRMKTISVDYGHGSAVL
ncbi:MAG: hypothetical protein ACRYFS_21475 [Janthinobacterium lividum]